MYCVLFLFHTVDGSQRTLEVVTEELIGLLKKENKSAAVYINGFTPPHIDLDEADKDKLKNLLT